MIINIIGKSKYILTFLLVLVGSLVFGNEINAQECDIFFGECEVIWEAGPDCAPGECESQGAYEGGSAAGRTDACFTGNGCPSWVCLESGGGVRDPEQRWIDGQETLQCCTVNWDTIIGHNEDFINEACYFTSKLDYIGEQCEFDYVEKYDCQTNSVCNYRWVCDDLRMFNKSLLKPVFAALIAPAPPGTCRWEPYNCQNVTTCKERDVEVCWDVPVYKDVEVCYDFWDVRWVETVIVEDGENCVDSTLSEGDSCWFCTGIAPVEPEPPCDPESVGNYGPCTESCGRGEQYRLDGCGDIFETRVCNTQACIVNSTVQGYIWDATGTSCTSDPSSLEITEGGGENQISGSITVSTGSYIGTWDPNTLEYSYEILDVVPGEYVLNTIIPSPNGSSSSYYLSCVNGTEIPVAFVNVDTNPEIVHLGYKLMTNGWFQSINGDVYGGCDENSCANSIEMDLPDKNIIKGGFGGRLVSGIGSVFGNSELSVTDSNYSEDGNRRLEYIGTNSWWPESLTFNYPTAAEAITDCNGVFSNNLEAGSVYYGSTSCIQDGLEYLSGDYSITSDGVAVVYVTGIDTLIFDKEFTSSSSARRILFMVEGSVVIESTLGMDEPTPSTPPHIQASIISDSDINFSSVGGNKDSTIIVEGPLVSRNGNIKFNRDRGVDNDYPSEVVVYNPIYLVSLSELLPFGLSSVDISWSIGN